MDDSMDSERQEHKADSSMGQYHSAYEIYDEKIQQCQMEIKQMKEKILEQRLKVFHFMRSYFTDNNYYNTLGARGNGVTRLESHSNSHTSEAGHNDSINGNNNNSNNNNNDGNGSQQEIAPRIPESRQAAEERLQRQLTMKREKKLEGHGNKVYAIDWHKDNMELISAARDAKCMIWNVQTGFRKAAFNLDTEFTMDCKYSPDCSVVACGGLDDTCSIYKLTDEMHGFKDIAPTVKLQEHAGYISSIAFMNNERVLTASGDQTLILWNINDGSVVDIYGSHWADVMSVSVKPDDANVFVSGSTDYTCRVWDIRLKNNSNPRRLSQEAAVASNINNTMNNSGNRPNIDNNNLSNDSSNNMNSIDNGKEYMLQLSQSGQYDSEYRRRNREPNPCVTHIYSMNNETDVNYVKWFPSGHCFAAGNEDGIIKLYDIRSHHCLNEFNFQESLGYVNPMHPNTVSNPNVAPTYRNLLDKPPMYGLNGNNHSSHLNNSSNEKGGNSNNDEDSRDRLKNGSHNIENTTELSHLQDIIEKYESEYEGVACLDFSLSGQYLFASYNGTSAILVWDVITGQIVERLHEHNYHVPKVTMSPDGKLLAASCWDKINYIYSRGN